MPMIAPLPMQDLDAECRERIEAGLKTGMYSKTLPLQIMAHAPAALRAMDEGYKAMFRRTLLDDRLRELLRIYSAELNGCGSCSQSRKEDSVSDEDLQCLADPTGGSLSPRERMALKFLTLMVTDHHAITRETYAELSEHFSTAEIVELGWSCASAMAGHRFMHSLDLQGESEPVLA